MTKRKYSAIHCGAGDAGYITKPNIPIGLCPSCDAILSVSELRDPNTGESQTALLHPFPFCHYFGTTDPENVVTKMHSIASGTQSK